MQRISLKDSLRLCRIKNDEFIRLVDRSNKDIFKYVKCSKVKRSSIKCASVYFIGAHFANGEFTAMEFGVEKKYIEESGK